MDLDEFHEAVAKAIGKRIVMMRRPAVVEMRRHGRNYIDLMYEEITDWAPLNHPYIDFEDGIEWIRVRLMDEPFYGNVC